MRPELLLGKPYRLGASFEKHQASDCIGLAREVLKFYKIKSPQPTRDWYRRLKKKDYGIFREQLNIWGVLTDSPKIGTVGLCTAAEGYGLAVYWEESGGWLSYQKRLDVLAVNWCQGEALRLEGCYCPKKLNFVI
tara:strand:- start:16 stop:420 length:405 start_codon:yes stop_codon:yes gene_type:complete